MLESLMDHLEHRFSGLELRRQANDAFSLVVNLSLIHILSRSQGPD